MNIIQLKKPNLHKIKMNCDECIDEKLLQYPMVADVWSHTSFNIIVGKMGSGKTSLMTNLVKNVFKKCFAKIYIFIPESSRKSIDNDIFGRNLPEDQIFDELTEENLEYVYNRLQENTEEGDYSLLIIDDFQVQLKDIRIVAILDRIITKMRHLRCTVFLLNQNYNKLVKNLRLIVSNIILFNVGKSSLDFIFDETIQLDKKKYQALIENCFVNKNDWILINVNGSKKIYRMFDEVILS
jgi:ABC-type branched-subunit amino acid transport system ATPase component